MPDVESSISADVFLNITLIVTVSVGAGGAKTTVGWAVGIIKVSSNLKTTWLDDLHSDRSIDLVVN